MNTLQDSRLRYEPKLPKILTNLSGISFSAQPTKPVQPEIAKLFPKTCGALNLSAKPSAPTPSKPMRIGVVFSGGPAAGGHNVVTGLFDALQKLSPESKLLGFLSGPDGIIASKYRELSLDVLAPYRNQGGFDLLGTGRTKIETDEQLKKSLQTCQSLSLDGLVVIGGDDSNTNAAVLAEYFSAHGCKTQVIGVPKTIDGDLRNEQVAISFGFDTATKTYAELIGNLAKDAASSQKYTHFVKLMGRSASHIALECALRTHPNLTLIGEEGKTLPHIITQIADMIIQRSKQGKPWGVILIPEGLIEFLPHLDAKALPAKIQEQLAQELDPHGNIPVSSIQTEEILIEMTKIELKKRNFSGGFHPLAHFFGYEGRCALPTNFDATYCYTLGHIAALLIHSGHTSYMCSVSNLTSHPSEWHIGAAALPSLLSLEERKGKLKPVIEKALVDLSSPAYQRFKKESPSWLLTDGYRCPGPIQFFGDAALTDSVPLSIMN